MGIAFSINNWEKRVQRKITMLQTLTNELCIKKQIVFKDGCASYKFENGKETIEWNGLPRSFGFFKYQDEWIGPYFIAEYNRKNM